MKDRSKPHIILAYEALFRRLKDVHRDHKTIVSDYQAFNAGFRGEQSVDYKLRILEEDRYFLYNGIRLGNNSYPFQMDTLIVTESFICIVEIKNLRGRIIYDSEKKQLIQVVDDKETAYKDPILQVETQKMNLTFWLKKYGISNIPIETLVVSANPSTIITNIQNDPNFYSKFIHLEGLPFQIKSLRGKHTKQIFDKGMLRKLNNLLLQEDSPLESNLVDKYGITERHLIKGVPCLKCYSYPMQRLYKKWSCPKCSYYDTIGHERVILDHFLLHNNTITNQECRVLLQNQSRKGTYIMLNSMKFKWTGNTRARKYYAPHPEDFPQESNLPSKIKSILDY